MTTYSEMSDAHHYRARYAPDVLRRARERKAAEEREAARRAKIEARMEELSARNAAMAEKIARLRAAEERAHMAGVEARAALEMVRDVAENDFGVCQDAVKRSAKAIIQSVAIRTGIPAGDIVGASRNKVVVAARFLAVRAVANERPDMSLPMIGRVFGNRDHTTILHALRKTKQEGQPR